MATTAYLPVPADFGLRLAAYLIDYILLWIVNAVLVAAVLLMDRGDLRTLVNLVPASWALAWAYYALFESSPLRGTIGKHVLGMYVADVRGDPITFWRASARYWLKTLSTLTLMVGWMMAAFTPYKQALHDLLAQTLVLTAVPEWTPMSPMDAMKVDDSWDGRRWIARSSASGGN